jgi:hypothetical protein
MSNEIQYPPASILERVIMMKVAELAPHRFETGEMIELITLIHQKRTWYGKRYHAVAKERMLCWRLSGLHVLLADESIARFSLIHHDWSGEILVSRKNEFIGGWKKIHSLHSLPHGKLAQLTRDVAML